MGQLNALFYKQWLISRRKVFSFLCQILAPVISILFIVLMTTLSRTFTRAFQGVDGDTLFPQIIYPANMINTKMNQLIANMSNITIEDSKGKNVSFGPIDYLSAPRIYRYALNGEIGDLFDKLVVATPDFFTYSIQNDFWKYPKDYPQWTNFSLNSSIKEEQIKSLNEKLISDLTEINELDMKDIVEVDTLPDASILINSIDDKFGIDAHFQVNNIMVEAYHRKNGDTRLVKNVTANKTKEASDDGISAIIGDSNSIRTFTEAAIAKVNLLNNMWLQSRIGSQMTNIYSIISPILNVDEIDSYLDSLFSIISTALFPVSLCMGLPLMLYVLVMEKEEKIRALLETNGLKAYNYWIVFYVFNFIILEFVTIIFLVLGKLIVDMSFFQSSSILINFYVFSIWNLSQISFALFLSTFISSSSSSTIVGYQSSIFLILFLAALSQFLFSYPASFPVLFLLIPPAPFVRYIYLSLHHCIDMSCIESVGDLSGEVLSCIIALHLNAGLFALFGVAVEEGGAKKAWEILVSLFGKNTAAGRRVSKVEVQQASALDGEDEEEEKESEGEKEEHCSARKYKTKTNRLDENDHRYALITKNLTMMFRTTERTFNALTDFSLSVKRGQIFGLLGPNGAGKTTLMSIITGGLKQTLGEAFICGRNTRNNANNLGEIGFCPQFDILWPEMNVEEHIIFLGMFKGQSYEDSRRIASNLIKDVDLILDYKKLASELSGGMKRRVSMAMSLVGDPKIIFLDEPSTGLDPVKRRHFWKLIKRITSDKAVLLTTHLMEEAETLCQDIGIISAGKLRCVGSSVYLKSQFTDGIKLQLVLKDKSSEGEKEMIEHITHSISDTRFVSGFKGTLLFTTRGYEQKLATIFEKISGFSEEFISDWSINLGSLEDVFLNVVSKYRSTSHK